MKIFFFYISSQYNFISYYVGERAPIFDPCAD